MPTDPVSAFLDALQGKAEQMPSGPYEVGEATYDTAGNPPDHTVYTPSVRVGRHGHQWPGYYDDLLEDEHHAAYFASLDRETVLALVRLAKAMMRYPQGTSWADYDELVAAEDAFRTLAAARMGGES